MLEGEAEFSVSENGLTVSHSPLYEEMAAYARMWGWSDVVFLSMPLRRRAALGPILEEQIKKVPKFF